MNITKRPTPSGYCTFCDDIRFEINNKISLIGIYGGELLPLGPFPLLLPKLCADINYYQSPEDAKTDIKIQVVFTSDGEERLLWEVSIPSQALQNVPFLIPPEPGDQPYIAARVPLEFPAFGIEKPGRIRVLVHRGDDVMRIGSLAILPFSPPPQLS
jgi:hypothetical protein